MLTTLSAWVAANCPAAAVQKTILAAAARAEAERQDYHLTIGSLLTKSRQPYLVQTYGGNLFVFALNRDHARRCGIAAVATDFCQDSERPVIAANPTLVIEGFEFDQSDRRKWSEPISGRCRFQSERTLPESLCLRIEFVVRQLSPPNSTCRIALYCYPWLPVGARSIEFEFPPAYADKSPLPFVTPQTFAVFLTVCTPPDSRRGQEATPISDSLGTLATFR